MSLKESEKAEEMPSEEVSQGEGKAKTTIVSDKDMAAMTANATDKARKNTEEQKKIREEHEKAVNELITKLEAVFVQDNKTVPGALDSIAQCYASLTTNFIDNNKEEKDWTRALVEKSVSWVVNMISECFEEAHGETLFGLAPKDVAKDEEAK